MQSPELVDDTVVQADGVGALDETKTTEPIDRGPSFATECGDAEAPDAGVFRGDAVRGDAVCGDEVRGDEVRGDEGWDERTEE